MVQYQVPPKLLYREEFISSYRDSDRYELIDGELIDQSNKTIF